MFEPSWLWAVFTLIAAAAQTVRNAAQRELTGKLGTVGATHVRFLFGCPFALAFLLAVLATGATLPRPGPTFWPWMLGGALAQIAATALMLAAMGGRSFVVAIAYIKTEPIQVALFGLIFLGDAVTPSMAAAIAIATAGVIAMAIKNGQRRPAKDGPNKEIRPGAAGGGAGILSSGTLVGLAAGGAFALSAIGYRGAILSLHDPNYLMAATFTMAAGLAVQSAVLSLYLALRDSAVLKAIGRAWRPSLFAGFMGALASQFWFLAFALATAASVRTLALVEVLFAQAISRFVFHQPVSRREGLGVVLIVAGVVLLIWAY
jgi:drug/metabolite transporter (DMT)-like permease